MNMASLVRTIFSFAVGAFWTFFVLLQCIRLAIFKREKFFTKKNRPVSPPCLQDPVYGEDNTAPVAESVKLHYKISGPVGAPLVLMLHGFPEFWYSWRHQIKHLNSKYRVVAVDLRGYGGSSKPSAVDSYTIPKLVEDIVALIAALDYGSAVILGHDWGGVLAWVLCIRYPHLVDKCCIMNCPHPVAMSRFVQSSWKQFIKSWYMFFINMPYFPEWYFTTGDLKSLDNAFTGKGMGAKPGAFSVEDMEAFKHSFNTAEDFTGPMNSIRCTIRGLNSAKGYSKKITDVPVMLLWGTKDKALSNEMATMSGDYVSDFQLHFIEGASHWVQQDEPAVVNEYIDTFLKTAL